MRCTTCNTALKPLFTSLFCPLGCDKPVPGGLRVRMQHVHWKNKVTNMRTMSDDPTPEALVYLTPGSIQVGGMCAFCSDVINHVICSSGYTNVWCGDAEGTHHIWRYRA